uniref:Uncharacterized protein n=1 Tax=Amphimedon queenslandica TaxID=400682 RepID=A0A1X7UNH3_AMPQE
YLIVLHWFLKTSDSIFWNFILLYKKDVVVFGFTENKPVFLFWLPQITVLRRALLNESNCITVIMNYVYGATSGWFSCQYVFVDSWELLTKKFSILGCFCGWDLGLFHSFVAIDFAMRASSFVTILTDFVLVLVLLTDKVMTRHYNAEEALDLVRYDDTNEVLCIGFDDELGFEDIDDSDD